MPRRDARSPAIATHAGVELGEDKSDDAFYEDAKRLVTEAGKASTSFLQRKLGIGYARAAHLIDMLEQHGVIGSGRRREATQSEGAPCS